MDFMIINPKVQDFSAFTNLLEEEMKKNKENEGLKIQYRDSLRELSETEIYRTDLCLVMDCDLDLASEIRRQNEKIPIVFYTDVRDYAQQCYDLDITFVLSKPANPATVAIMMKRIRRKMEEGS